MKYSKFNVIIEGEEYDKYILFNTLTGHSILIDSLTKSLIEDNNIVSLDPETKKMFESYSITVGENINEDRYFSYFHNKQKFSGGTVSSTILLTWACNLKCTYCYEGAGLTRNATLNQRTADMFIKFIKNESEMKSANTISINLFGGEPLLKIDMGFYILEELDKYCKEKGKMLVSSIITNGTLITDDILNRLESYNCKMIQITLDGTKDIHDNRRMYKSGRGSFDAVLAGIKLASARSLKPVIRINVDKTNLHETYELLELLEKEGLSECHIDFGIVRGSTAACSSYSGHCFSEEELGEILDQLWNVAALHGFHMSTKPFRKWMYCGLYGDSSYTIAPNGQVYKCWEHVGEEKHMIGRLDEDGALADLKYAFYDWMSRNPLETASCKACVYLPACGGGCGVVSYNEHGSYHEKGCFKTRGVLEKQVKRFFQNKNKEVSVKS
ncbi:hypothetical protein D3C87_982040 [compost metagenome]